MPRTILAVVALAVAASAAPAYAQSQAQAQGSSGTASQAPSLGELAKKEQERRKAAAAQGQAPKKVYTNSDLKSAPPPPDSATGDKAGDTAKDAGKSGDKDAQPADKAADKDKGPAPEKTEKYWRDRMNNAREEMRRNEMFRDALQARINGLTADFSARDDPYQRAQIADDRQKALAELDRVNDEIEKGKKAIADIEDEARRASVPAGWIR